MSGIYGNARPTMLPRTNLSYDPATQKFTLPPEQAMVFAIDDSPVNMIGAFDSMVAFTGNQDEVQPAFKHGGGVAWGDQSTCLFCAVARWPPPPPFVSCSACQL
jgi:hypothetical protein